MQPTGDDSAGNGEKCEDPFDLVFLGNSQCLSRSCKNVSCHLKYSGSMKTGSPSRKTNHRHSIFFRNTAQILIGRSQDHDSIPSAGKRSTEIFSRVGRPGAQGREFVVDEQVGH